MKSVWSTPGTCDDVHAGLLQRLDRRRRHVLDRIDLAAFSAETSASSFENIAARNRRPAASARRIGLSRWKSAISSFLNLTSMNGPAPTIGRGVRERLQVVALVAGVLAQMCFGRIANCWNCERTLPDGCRVVNDERRSGRRLGPLDVGDQTGGVRGAGALVLDVRVDRPGGVRGGQRLPVRPLRRWQPCERPGHAVLRGLPRASRSRARTSRPRCTGPGTG